MCPLASYTLTQGTQRHALVITYLQYSSDQQDLDSIHSQCTQFSSSPLEPDLGHNCRTLLNHVLCQCSSPENHSRGQQGIHNQLRESSFFCSDINPITEHAVMLQIEYSLSNSHQPLSASNFIILCNVSVSRDLLQAIIQFWNTPICFCRIITKP